MKTMRSWRRADKAVYLLFLLVLLVIGLASLLFYNSLEGFRTIVVDACMQAFENVISYRLDFIHAVILLPFVTGIGLGVAEAVKLQKRTNQWIESLRVGRVELSERLNLLATRCGVEGKVLLIDVNRPIAFTHGLLTPNVWLSTGLCNTLNDAELEAVLRHEAHHVFARDPLKILFVRIMARLLFFMPIANELFESYSVGKEVAADAYAHEQMQDARPLLRALRKLLETEFVGVPSAVLASGFGVTETRMLSLLDPKVASVSISRKSIITTLLLLIGLSAFIVFNTTQVEASEPFAFNSMAECLVPEPLNFTPFDFTPMTP